MNVRIVKFSPGRKKKNEVIEKMVNKWLVNQVNFHFKTNIQMDYKDNPKQEYSYFGKIQQSSRLNDKSNQIQLPILLSNEIRKFINFVQNKEGTLELIYQCLETIKNILADNLNANEQLILSQFVSSLLSFLKFISLNLTEPIVKDDTQNDPLSVKLQLVIFEILKILSNGSNIILKDVVCKNELFSNLFEIAESLKLSKQILPYFEVFHLFFLSFNKISTPYQLPSNVISTLNCFADYSIEEDPSIIVPSLVRLYEDFFVNLILSDDDMMDILTILCIFLINFDIDIYRSVESLLKQLLKRSSFPLFFNEFNTIIEFYVSYVKEIVEHNENTEHNEIDDNVEQNDNTEQNRNVDIAYEICSVIDSAYQSLSSKNNVSKEEDVAEYQHRLLDTFDMQLLWQLLKHDNSKNYDVSSVINLMSYHLTYDVGLDEFVRNGGYDLIIDFLLDTKFQVVTAVLSLLYSMSVSFGWQAMPINAFPVFMENFSDILNETDTETALLFMKGFGNALNSGIEFRQKAISLYLQFDDVVSIVSSLAFNESKEVAEQARYIIENTKTRS